MRLTTDFFVSATIRAVFSAGGYASIVRRGAMEAGAVFIVSRNPKTGEQTLFGPAPQSLYDPENPLDRRFQRLAMTEDSTAIDERLAREAKFDPDLWIVEIEPAGGEPGAFISVERSES